MKQDEPSAGGTRNGPDRRRRDLPFWSLRRLRGRRIKMRRADEQGRSYLVDRVSWMFFATATLLLILTLVDGLITLALLDHGCEEANPFMAYLLARGTNTFLIGKYVLTATFLPVALVLNHYRLFGTKLRVGHFIPVVAVLYLILIGYQTVLWRQRLQAERDSAASSDDDARATWPSIDFQRKIVT